MFDLGRLSRLGVSVVITSVIAAPSSLGRELATPQRVCGVYRTLESCGDRQGLTPVLEVEGLGRVRLRSTCFLDHWYACRLRTSLLLMMKEGAQYCVEGDLQPGNECSDRAMNFEFVVEAGSP